MVAGAKSAFQDDRKAAIGLKSSYFVCAQTAEVCNSGDFSEKRIGQLAEKQSLDACSLEVFRAIISIFRVDMSAIVGVRYVQAIWSRRPGLPILHDGTSYSAWR